VRAPARELPIGSIVVGLAGEVLRIEADGRAEELATVCACDDALARCRWRGAAAASPPPALFLMAGAICAARAGRCELEAIIRRAADQAAAAARATEP
jgi:hypothetical protein